MVNTSRDRVAVMYLGKIVEIAGSESCSRNPLHPYTQALIAAVPITHPGASGARGRGARCSGDIPSALNPPSGCHFPRCPLSWRSAVPRNPKIAEPAPGRQVACHLVGSA